MQKMNDANRYTISIGAKGRIILPTALQRQANLQEGEKLVITVGEDGKLYMEPLRTCAKACEGMFAHLAPGISLADELIAERREAAQKEADEFGL